MQRSRIGLALLALVLLASCLQGPLIQSFSASSEAVAKDTEVTLRWSASNYDTLTLTPSVGNFVLAIRKRCDKPVVIVEIGA